MKFTHRLAYYLLGLLVGGFFLKFVIDYSGAKNMEFAYLPNARVLKNIRTKSFHYSDIATQKIAQKWIDTTDIKKILTDGDIDFEISKKPEDGGKVYFINGETNDHKKITLKVINYEQKALLKDIVIK
ncbi:DUF4258 domain-containing protein [Flavobacterium branchiophilum]|uniref:DUF4258 domain-containing protein n=2 Tax=Flavobacterium branchiophilum TaxID=55197 RepID=G2Z7E2_FLABF|nr:DUF4258 domain-containing protein [Flavobacterium branchiophilum]PDS24788.1 hypothetical protein B0A77_06990 [Flavobacterium branchiophilum]CCB69047.1 Probable transmembrane protein of unknown function [Flavobacterium branchiophilum FL-15]